ncbi:MAG: preprotein translocase subunit YajC [Actinomycetota bacterium]
MESLGTLLPILLIGVVFYLLIMRPARNRQKKQQAMMAALQPGSRIMTTAGIFATVVEMDDDNASIEIAPGVVIRVVKAAIGRVLDEPESPELEAPPASGSETPACHVDVTSAPEARAAGVRSPWPQSRAVGPVCRRTSDDPSWSWHSSWLG